MKKALAVIGFCLIVSVISFVGIREYMESEGIDFTIHGQIAMGIGIFFTMLIGFGLMALLFFSNKNGHDEVVYELSSEDGYKAYSNNSSDENNQQG
ncbi:hypothetical protein [Kordiimonas sp. SCSIO 12610]|uniref:hypothetical protein n=1 Tax=Kordiimonas sp. SCSIO 12610 TaxID=2829597 RepID=UPI00210F05F7|nr:hypothetical protein [Kordiimonas sp. SCSIO 12610]UTW54408.1 hypothetical protein KFF44_11370 [Kordiimonas sp. SCSIO 12610]